MLGPESRATEIALDLLERTEKALFSNDFEAFLADTALPFIVESFDGRLVVQTVAELKSIFDNVVARNAANNINGYQRDLISAGFTSPAEIKYAYVTRRLSGHMLADEAYPNIAIARLIGGDWKIVSAQHAMRFAYEVRQASAEPHSTEPTPKKSQ